MALRYADLYGRHGEVMSPTQSKGAGAGAGTGRTRRVKFEDATRFRDSLEVQTLEQGNPSGEVPIDHGGGIRRSPTLWS